MKSHVAGTVACALLILCWLGQASCAEVVGMVKDLAGKPVQGVKIQAVDASGTVVGQALSGPKGTYAINGLVPAKYVFKLDPLATGFKPGDGVAYLGVEGLTIDWTVSTDAVALDDATPGTGVVSTLAPLLTPGAIPVVGGAVAGAVLGGLGAAGSLGGGGTTTPSL